MRDWESSVSMMLESTAMAPRTRPGVSSGQGGQGGNAAPAHTVAHRDQLIDAEVAADESNVFGEQRHRVVLDGLVAFAVASQVDADDLMVPGECSN